MLNIILTTESGSDIPQTMADELDVRIIPMHVILGDKTYPDCSIPVSDCFDFFRQTKKMPTTSAVNPQEYALFFLKLRKEYPDADIIHIAYSSAASSTWQHAKIALEDLGDRRIYLVDSKTVSGGIALLLWKAAHLIKSAENAEAAVREIHRLIEREETAFLPDTLEYLCAGGRVSNAAYFGTSLLRLKIQIHINGGRLVASRKYRGHMGKVAFQFLEEFVSGRETDREAVMVFYTSGFPASLLEQMKQRCRAMGFQHVLESEIGCVISCHGGPGAVGLAAFVKEEARSNR